MPLAPGRGRHLRVEFPGGALGALLIAAYLQGTMAYGPLVRPRDCEYYNSTTCRRELWQDFSQLEVSL